MMTSLCSTLEIMHSFIKDLIIIYLATNKMRKKIKKKLDEEDRTNIDINIF